MEQQNIDDIDEIIDGNYVDHVRFSPCAIRYDPTCPYGCHSPPRSPRTAYIEPPRLRNVPRVFPVGTARMSRFPKTRLRMIVDEEERIARGCIPPFDEKIEEVDEDIEYLRYICQNKTTPCACSDYDDFITVRNDDDE